MLKRRSWEGGGGRAGTMPPPNSLVTSLFFFLDFCLFQQKNRNNACQKFASPISNSASVNPDTYNEN